MEHYSFYYIPSPSPLPRLRGRGLRHELSRTIKVRGHELSIRRSIIYTNINKIIYSLNFALSGKLMGGYFFNHWESIK